jgi:hypothetical protein
METFSYDGTSNFNLTIRVDQAASPILYVGKAPTGSAEASAVWQIIKVDLSTVILVKYADGDAEFDNVWNDRSTLTYA